MSCLCPSELTGVRELVVYPLSPTAVILSWQRRYHVAFRKYILQTFFFNPVTLASEWTTYYEIAATGSVVASMVTRQLFVHLNETLVCQWLVLDRFKIIFLDGL